MKRSIAKSTAGDRLRFSEHHPELGLTFSYTWTTASDFGFVRSCELTADADRSSISVDVLDGLVNILPAGVELAHNSRRAPWSMPTAVLRSTRCRVWHCSRWKRWFRTRPTRRRPCRRTPCGCSASTTATLPSRRIRCGPSGPGHLEPEPLVIGRKGAYLVSTTLTVAPGIRPDWSLVADVGQDHVAVSQLRQRLTSAELSAEVERAIEAPVRRCWGS